MKLFAVAAALLASAAAQNPFSLSFASNGGYTLSVNGFTAFKLNSGDTFVQSGSTVYSSGKGTLTMGPNETFTGADAWGTYSATAYDWQIAGTTSLRTTFKVYDNVPAVIFEQSFPAGIAATGGNYQSKDGVVSGFPTVQLPQSAGLGFMQYNGPFIDDGTIGPRFGAFQSGAADLISGLTAGSGPLVVYDASGANAVVFSAASEFMAASSATGTTAAGAQALNFGVMGSATSIPQWYTVETVAWYGGAGINTAMQAWGAGLLSRYDKAHGLSKVDYTNTHLGYNTDHGAYYYYTTTTFPDYSAVLSAVWNYSQAVGIPYKHVLLDSWWYFKGVGGGVKNWTAMPDVFNGGNAGIRAMVEQTGWKIIAHNRYWSSNTDYATANGGKWQFYVDQSKSPAGGQMAVPLEQAFWEWLLQDSVTEWGLTTYEQDWLFNELEGVDALTSDVTLGRQWLMNMGAGAEAAGVSIQYCMPYPRHVLQSVEIPAVTQTRASDDHVPGEGYYPLQWRMGYSSIFSWAVGVAPFKDNFWSTSSQPGGSCGNSKEISPGLHGAISVFSAGPVTPGDGIGYSDVGQIMRTCGASGRLLHPSRAMTAIDSQLVGRAFPGTPGTTSGEVYATYSSIDGWAWDHVLGADMNTSYAVTRQDLASIRADIPLRAGGRVAVPSVSALSLSALSSQADGPRVAYTLDTGSLALTSLKVQSFNDGDTIPLAACGETDFQVWHTAPVFTVAGTTDGWALLGELSKWVPVSEARVQQVSVSEDVAVTVMGQVGEVVPLTFWSSANGGNITTVTCAIGASGTAQAVMPYGRCA